MKLKLPTKKREFCNRLSEVIKGMTHTKKNTQTEERKTDLIPSGRIQFILSTIEFNKIVRLDSFCVYGFFFIRFFF